MVWEASVGEREVPPVLQGRRGFGASGSASAAKAAGAGVFEAWTAGCRPFLSKTLRHLYKYSPAVSALPNVCVCSQALFTTRCLFTQRTALAVVYRFSLKS